MSDGIIRSLGAGSGIDTSSLVSNLVEIQRTPIENRLNEREERLEAQISAYGTLKSSFAEFQSAMAPLADNDTFNARSVAFPDSDVITPNSVEPGAQTGTYQIEVVEVAQAQSLATGSHEDKDAVLNETGTLTISFGAWTYDGVSGNPDSFAANGDRAALNIDVEATDTLQDIADKINAEDADLQASVLLVDGQYQMLLTAPSGENNAIRISSDDATKGDSTGLSAFEFNESEFSQVTETQKGRDAEIKVNGLTVLRETNDIDDVIQGFDFSLNRADPGASLTFTVSEDTAIAEQAVRDFVTAYNLFYETSRNLTNFSTNEDNQVVQGDLSNDGGAKLIINQLRSTLTNTVPGVESGFTALTNLGIRTELDGTLSIDEEDFSDAFNDNFELIERLFAPELSSSNSQVTVTEGSFIDDASAGTHEVIIGQNPEKATFTTNAISLDLSSPPVTLGADYAFKITVDGVKSEDIVLTGSYSSQEQIRADLQSLINGDSNLSERNIQLDVGLNGGQFTFTSRSYGSSSEIGFDTADFADPVKAAELGLLDANDRGVDVIGGINGEAAFGSGNILLPPIGSDAYGLNFVIGENAVAQGPASVTYTIGLAGELSNLIDSFLSSSGPIENRESNINTEFDVIEDEREELDRKMGIFEDRLTGQFLAMERIIGSLQSTGNQLNGILDRLPFTASNS